MNAPEKIPFADQFALSRQPFPASRKVHVAGTQPGVNVPMREILLTNGERVTVTRPPPSTSALACQTCAAPGWTRAAIPKATKAGSAPRWTTA